MIRSIRYCRGLRAQRFTAQHRDVYSTPGRQAEEKMAVMKAAVVHQPGGPEVLKIEERPIPEPQPGWVRIRVRAFGLNRAEIHTRRGESPGVTFPRILGI